MLRFKKENIVLLVMLVLVVFPFSHAFAKRVSVDDLFNALKSGTPGVQLRLGYEMSDLDNNSSRTANSVTLRTRLSYRTGELELPYVKASGFLQFHNLSAFLDHYSPEKLTYDTVADPDGNRIQQAYLDLKAFDTTLRIGRQEIIMDDHRLIGNIDWRQNGQSFNGVSLTNKSIQDFEFFASYITKINTILLKEVPLDDMGLILGHIKYTGIKDTTISVYDYLLDSRGDTKNDRDIGTLGARVTGDVHLTDKLHLPYAVNYSHQHGYRNGRNYGGYMVNSYVGLEFHEVEFGGGYNRISGQKGERKAFDTLFSTAHKFNGWSDQFLATNGGNLVNGLEDIYFQIKAKCTPGKTKFVLRYHIFDTANNYTTSGMSGYSGTYGNEFDALIKTKLRKDLSLLFKYASYFASNGTGNPKPRDENVFWTRLEYRFN